MIRYKPKTKSSLPPFHAESIHKIAHNRVQHAKPLEDILDIPMPHNRVNMSINEHHVNANVRKIVLKK